MNHIPAECTLKEYRKKYASPEHYKKLKSNAIGGYVLVTLNAVVSILANPYGMIDTALQLGLILGIHKGVKKGCAVGLLVYAIVSMLIGLAESGKLTGWLWIILAINFLNVFKKIDQDYAAANRQSSPEF